MASFALRGPHIFYVGYIPSHITNLCVGRDKKAGENAEDAFDGSVSPAPAKIVETVKCLFKVIILPQRMGVGRVAFGRRRQRDDLWRWAIEDGQVLGGTDVRRDIEAFG